MPRSGPSLPAPCLPDCFFFKEKPLLIFWDKSIACIDSFRPIDCRTTRIAKPEWNSWRPVGTPKTDATLRQAWSERDDGTFAAELPQGWGQGRTVFGGLLASYAAALAGLRVPHGRRLRGAQMQFLRPTTPGRVSATLRLLREGKNVSFVEVRLAQDRGESFVAQLAFSPE